MEQKTKRRYITGLDGVRTLAVLGVIFYHLLPDKVKGGYLGVAIFFAISGYLITDHLNQEWQATGKIRLLTFYKKRLKRLWPNLALVMVLSTAYITLFQRNLLNNLRGVFFSSLLFFNNWWQINNGASYFDRFNNESPFTHIWYTAVEAQNYLIWPIIFIILMLLLKKRGKIFIAIVIGAIASAIWMAILFKPGSDPTRVYYGTDTRVFGIWLGSALAFIWPSNHLKEKIPREAKRLLNGVGLGSLLLLILSFFFLSDQSKFLYYGGFFLISIICVLLVAVVVHPGASLNKWLTNPIFSYIGSRSYWIYLYQYPVMIFYEAKIKNLADNVLLHTIVEIFLIMLLSELSYQFFEKPLKNFDYSKTWQTVKGWFKKPILSRQKPALIPTIAILAITLVGLVIAPVNHVDANQQRMKEQILANRKIAAESKKTAKEKTTESSTSGSQDKEATAKQAEQHLELAKKYGVTDQQVKKSDAAKFTFFGDSVMLGAAAGLNEMFPNSVVDAEINRQVYASVDLLQKLKDDKLLHDTVIIGLGTNSPFTDQQFADIMNVMGKDRKVYWINMRAPTVRTQGTVNAALTKMAKQYKNLTIIDWYDYSINHGEWFYEDGTHINPDGLTSYVKLMVDSLIKD